MTTLRSGDRRIDVTFGTTKTETKRITTEEKVYTITLPVISCNDEEDAKIIETNVNKFVSDLVKEVLEQRSK